MGRPTPAFDWIGHRADLAPDLAALIDDNRRLAVPELQPVLSDCRPELFIDEGVPAGAAAQLEAPIKLELGIDCEAAKAVSDPGPVGTVAATHDHPWSTSYTSGTTRRPEGEICRHGMFFWNASNVGHAVRLTTQSTHLDVPPTLQAGDMREPRSRRDDERSD
jgi:non-ribosomal peptide synthetase component F